MRCGYEQNIPNRCTWLGLHWTRDLPVLVGSVGRHSVFQTNVCWEALSHSMPWDGIIVDVHIAFSLVAAVQFPQLCQRASMECVYDVWE
jgi:hypothetical protein